MGILTLSQLKPGLRLSAAVHDGDGKVVLSAGVKLTEKHIQVLVAHNIASVNVHDEAPLSPEKIEELFTYTDKNNPFIAEIIAHLYNKIGQPRQ